MLAQGIECRHFWSKWLTTDLYDIKHLSNRITEAKDKARQEHLHFGQVILSFSLFLFVWCLLSPQHKKSHQRWTSEIGFQFFLDRFKQSHSNFLVVSTQLGRGNLIGGNGLIRMAYEHSCEAGSGLSIYTGLGCARKVSENTKGSKLGSILPWSLLQLLVWGFLLYFYALASFMMDCNQEIQPKSAFFSQS
jgi:hypothetical protein